MIDTQLVMYDEDFDQSPRRHPEPGPGRQRQGRLRRRQERPARSPKPARCRASTRTSLASLTAGSIAATGGLAKIVGEEEFPIHFHQGERDNLHITLVGRPHHPGRHLRRAQLARSGAPARQEGRQRARARSSKRSRRRPSSEARRRRHALRRDHRRRHRQPVLGLTRAPMSFINYSSREINCKIVYYGPGLCGKTTNLQYIYSKTNPDVKGKMISLATETERTLFFDFLPLALGEIRGFKTRFHLYTVPGQVFYDASRKLILKGVDGVVFVADSQIERMEANIESLDNLQVNLPSRATTSTRSPTSSSTTSATCPTRPRSKSCSELLNPQGVPDFEACATDGQGRLRDAQGRRQGRAHRPQEDGRLSQLYPRDRACTNEHRCN